MHQLLPDLFLLKGRAEQKPDQVIKVFRESLAQKRKRQQKPDEHVKQYLFAVESFQIRVYDQRTFGISEIGMMLQYL